MGTKFIAEITLTTTSLVTLYQPSVYYSSCFLFKWISQMLIIKTTLTTTKSFAQNVTEKRKENIFHTQK